MAITNHERVGKALELLKSGLGPFVEREFKSIYKDRAAAEDEPVPGRGPPERKEADRGMGCGRAAEAHVGSVERCFPHDPRAQPSAAWSANCATTATNGRTRRPSPATTPTARSTRRGGC